MGPKDNWAGLKVLGRRAAMLACAATFATSAGAAPSTQECLAASEKAIALRERHQLIAARETLLICAEASCPEDVRTECTRDVEEVNAALPSVAFRAQDADGNDLGGVTITVDGERAANQAAGVAVALDPGAHTFLFEAAGQDAVTKNLVLVEGERNRQETVVFGARGVRRSSERDYPPQDTKRTSNGTTQRVLGYTAMGVGVAGVAIGVVFELERSSTLHERDGICPSGVCPRDELAASQGRVTQLTSDANTQGNIAVVGFVAGGVLLAGGLTLVLMAPSGRYDVALAPVLAPGLQGMAATGRF
jgi:hypothetical protein